MGLPDQRAMATQLVQLQKQLTNARLQTIYMAVLDHPELSTGQTRDAISAAVNKVVGYLDGHYVHTLASDTLDDVEALITRRLSSLRSES